MSAPSFRKVNLDTEPPTVEECKRKLEDDLLDPEVIDAWLEHLWNAMQVRDLNAGLK